MYYRKGISMDPLNLWLADLLNTIGSSPDKDTCISLLKQCGAHCAQRNALPSAAQMKADLSKASNLTEIAAVIRRHTGAECVPAAGGFVVTYNWGKGCDCPLVKDGHVASPVFCNCTMGFHETLWSAMFEKPVTVELLESFLRGGSCCAQKITFK